MNEIILVQLRLILVYLVLSLTSITVLLFLIWREIRKHGDK